MPGATEGASEVAFIARDPTMLGVVAQVRRLAPFDTTVVFIGETGTGKTTLACALAAWGPSRKALVEVVSCAAMPEHLVESQLFGHKKGAFTGAITDYRGAFERAGEGLLLFDDLDKMALPAQAKLLRALRERRFAPVGGAIELHVRCRIAVASKVPLEELQRTGRLLEDLRYRVDVDTVVVPPARERPEDVLAVVNRALRLERATAVLDAGARSALLSYEFPGNMGEADAVGRSLGHLGRDQIVEADVVARIPALSGLSCPRRLEEIAKKSRKDAVVRAVLALRGDVNKAAKELGISRSLAYSILTDSDSHSAGVVPVAHRQLYLQFREERHDPDQV